MARPASGEGIRVYANDVLDDLLAEAEPSASSLPEHEFSETDPEECTTSEPPRSALPELSGSRQSQRPVSFWERNSLTPDAGERATLSSGRKMSERQIAQLKVREEELARVNEEFERNQHQMMDRNRKRREVGKRRKCFYATLTWVTHFMDRQGRKRLTQLCISCFDLWINRRCDWKIQ
jgi:hypothetical protein